MRVLARKVIKKKERKKRKEAHTHTRMLSPSAALDLQFPLSPSLICPILRTKFSARDPRVIKERHRVERPSSGTLS